MAVSAPAPAALSARGIVKAFGGRRILDGLDLELPARARVGLIGANGSGKSTLLRLLAGADAPDDGAITLRRGAVVGPPPPAPPARAPPATARPRGAAARSPPPSRSSPRAPRARPARRSATRGPT